MQWAPTYCWAPGIKNLFKDNSAGDKPCFQGAVFLRLRCAVRSLGTLLVSTFCSSVSVMRVCMPRLPGDAVAHSLWTTLGVTTTGSITGEQNTHTRGHSESRGALCSETWRRTRRESSASHVGSCSEGASRTMRSRLFTPSGLGMLLRSVGRFFPGCLRLRPFWATAQPGVQWRDRCGATDALQKFHQVCESQAWDCTHVPVQTSVGRHRPHFPWSHPPNPALGKETLWDYLG